MQFTNLVQSYSPKSDAQIVKIWKDADFCFDTNVLLNTYRYQDKNRVSFFKLLGALKGRIFVPHQVGLEFARNRAGVIFDHFGPQRMLRSKLEQALKDIVKQFEQHEELDSIREVVDSMQQVWSDNFADAEKIIEKLLIDDHLFNELVEILGNDIGEPLSEETIQREFKTRKQDNIPPYCEIDDKEKSEGKNPAGDITVWLEIMERYKDLSKPVIFVTGDRKKNWWADFKGRKVPQPALVLEAAVKMKSDVLFYSPERFIEAASLRLGLESSSELAEETKQLWHSEFWKYSANSLARDQMSLHQLDMINRYSLDLAKESEDVIKWASELENGPNIRAHWEDAKRLRRDYVDNLYQRYREESDSRKSQLLRNEIERLSNLFQMPM